jgi:hypothetical protein
MTDSDMVKEMYTMPLIHFRATAATCEVTSGTTTSGDDGMLHLRGQIFRDRVESQEPRVAGTNQPVLDIALNPQDQQGTLRGTFTLKPHAINGAWEGELEGHFVQGLVTSAGMARGTGALAGAVLWVEFRQITAYPGNPPCPSPSAFFEMQGIILE